MSKIVKRKDLRLGEHYVVMEKHRGYGGSYGPPTYGGTGGRGMPPTIGYRRVVLLELRSGNRAVVMYEAKRLTHPIGHPDRQVVVKVHLVEISCANILATVADWDERGATFDLKARHLVLNPPKPAVDNLEGQTEIGAAA